MTITEAIANLRKTSKEKFDASVELHINLGIDPKRADQMVRFSTTLPHGNGKSKKVAVLANKEVKDADLNLKESDLPKIIKGTIKPKADFDVLITEPEFMVKVAQVAKILGPAGAMPNPKNGTVTKDVEKAVEQIKKGKLDIKTEKDMPLIHVVIGKKSFDDNKLEENFAHFIKTLRQARPQKVSPDWIKSVFITSSMGKAYKVDLE